MICIIPARGNSRRIPHKNIKMFHGEPIISYSIRTAIESHLFEEIYVSTDDPDIADISKQYGAKILTRQGIYARDEVGTQEVMRGELTGLETTDYACCLYATSPLLYADDLVNAHNQILSDGAKYCVSVGTEPLRDAGNFYFGLADAFLKGDPLYWVKTTLYPLPEYRVCDINTQEDFDMAEELYKGLNDR